MKTKFNFRLRSVSLVMYSLTVIIIFAYVAKDKNSVSKLFDANVEALTLSYGETDVEKQKYAEIEDVSTPCYEKIFVDSVWVDSLVRYEHKITCKLPCKGFGTYCFFPSIREMHYAFNNYSCGITWWFDE